MSGDPLKEGRGSERYRRIWAAVAAVPRGRVATYGQIAQLAGFPRQARQVGYALHALPRGHALPWHRVINAHGRISFPPRSAPCREQRRRLEAEGVVFLRGSVDLKRFGWRPSNPAPLFD